jgi:hypothetical protein
MRNPFKRQRRLPGADAVWNEAEHVAVGDHYVAIPSDQLSPEARERGMTVEAVERLAEVELYEFGDSGPCVLVNMTATQAAFD